MILPFDNFDVVKSNKHVFVTAGPLVKNKKKIWLQPTKNSDTDSLRGSHPTGTGGIWSSRSVYSVCKKFFSSSGSGTGL